ncbi:acyl carrier protein [Actinoplanes sp. L3-i22]|uniref:acyl carrier protein n=1 Tax=Actinoplanes sp. L3-i22 TaxID=2836373 RepID=UPI001C7952E5|nr:acyl carrier protein [Actinoplanes sp. L3-i22]BCY10573.1 acyl carrier protein [Actinoplanes sp. L3-i22]
MSADRLKKVFTEVLDISPDTDWDTLEYRGSELWDSVAHMQLVGEIEEAFDIMLETGDVLAMSSFAETVKILQRHGVSLD